MNSPVPILVAHRGYPAEFPENSIEGINAALQTGACYIEFDVQISSDGIPVLLHDENLIRTANSDISVFASTLAELKQYVVGEADRFGEKYPQVRIPTLAEVITLLKQWPRARAFIEIKRGSLRHFGHQAVVDAVAELIGPVRDQCIIISFDYTVVEQVKNRQLCRTGWAIKKMDSHARDLALQLGPDFLFFSAGLLPAAGVTLWPGVWQWVVYSINDPQLALQMASRGIALVETDAIGHMLQHEILRQNKCGKDQQL